MKGPIHERQVKNMLYYFFIAIIIIVTYKFIMGIDVFFGFIKWFLSVVSPFIYGFFLAYVLSIPCGGISRLLERSKKGWICKRKKPISIAIVYLLLFFVIFMILRVVLPYLYRSITLFGDNYGSYYRSAQDFINYVNGLDILNIDIRIDEILNVVREFTLQKLPLTINTLVNISSGIFGSVLSFISSIYILLEKDNFIKYLKKAANVFLSKPVYSLTLKYVKDLNTSFKQYIYTQTIDGVILGTIATIELSLLKSPYAMVLGIMLGIVNYIPYFGSIFGTIFVVFIVAFTQGLETSVLTAVILLITQQLDANVIQPRLLGESFSLSPLLIIISITIGGAISGIIGMIAAIPIIAVIKNVLDEIILHFENLKNKKSIENDYP